MKDYQKPEVEFINLIPAEEITNTNLLPEDGDTSIGGNTGVSANPFG